MAPKRLAPLEDPPAASSSEQEDVESEQEDVESEEEELESGQEEEEEEESSEEEEVTPVQKQQQPEQQHQVKKALFSSVDSPRTAAAIKKKSLKVSEVQSQSSSSDEGSDPDSVSDKPLSQQVTDLNVKPISSKPADVHAQIEKQKPTVTALPALTPTKAAGKRSISKSGEVNDSKRAKKETDADPPESERKPLFQRLWTEDDEIVILKGILNFTLKNGVDPSTDMDAFYEFIKNSLESDGTRTQLMDKIRRLKKKYRTNAAKVNKGKRTFPNAHEQLTFDLSKKLWENSDSTNGGSVDQTKPNGKAKKVKKIENLVTLAEKGELPVAIMAPVVNDVSPKKDISNESILFKNSVGSMGLDESFMKEGLSLIDSAKKLELETKWRNLQVAEAEMFLRRIELVQEQTKLVLDAFNKH